MLKIWLRETHLHPSRTSIRMPCLAGLVIVLGYGSLAVGSQIKRDEEVIFFPTAARLNDEGTAWIAPIHGWIFEPEHDDLLRGVALRELAKAVGLDRDQARKDQFYRVARWLLVDNERGKELTVRIDELNYSLPASGANGHFDVKIEIPRAVADRRVSGGRLSFSAVTDQGDDRHFAGQIQLLPVRGLSVISDIDDTLKSSEVRDKQKLIENTFLHPPRAVPGMSQLYQRWAEQGATFHFVSASPWQLYPVLSAFTAEAGFPDASWHLRAVRLKDSSALNLFAESSVSKRLAIELLLADFPERDFVLVGDSGEQDPELYGRLARKYPRQILRVFIRNVTHEGREDARYQAAFEGVPARTWDIFNEPTEVHLQVPPARHPDRD